MSKLINGFCILTRVKNGIMMEYVKNQYLLKPGDKIFICGYEDRGLDFRNGTIMETTDEYITLGDVWLYEDETFILPFHHEPDYRQMFADCKIEPEKRELEIVPFPVFVEGFRKSTLSEAIHPSIEYFDKKSDLAPKNYEAYLKNFENIICKQVSIF
ncbi:hypothetical protein [Tepidanaerobacter syntrophicus]|uniref:hypothetical protein n=1 Tax=Tepidanaerobacter syntrophicus TaxID=224999 RepID=UPI001BD20112|nr:hypothetical protein [Tepidanaerobacter syntrophicus]